MTSRPLRIAFTALTLSLAVSLSLWVLHASYEQREFSQAVTLRMPSAPAEINSHEVRENLNASRSAVERFAATETQPPMVELEEPPDLIGIEAAPVSQNSSGDSAPPFPSGDEIEDLPELSLDVAPQEPQQVDEPLELPELILDEPADEPSEVLPQLDPAGPEPETAQQPPASPIVELMVEPLVAPRPPAWLSVQATLEAEIQELRQQQQTLQAALAESRSAAAEWKEQERVWQEQRQTWEEEKQELTEQLTLAQKDVAEFREQFAESNRQAAAAQKLLQTSQREADSLRKQKEQLEALLEESQNVNGDLKNTLKEKLSLIGRLENDARKARQEIEELRSSRQPVRGLPQYDTPQFDRSTSIQRTTPDDSGAPALLPPRPNEVDDTAESDLVQDQAVVPRLAGRPDPPTEVEQPLPAHSYERHAPLIPAEISRNDAGRCARCGACLDAPPAKKKGLIYDLKDWFHHWRDGQDCCSVCEPICTDTGLCTQTAACGDDKTGLIPGLISRWKHRREKCDCGCH